MVDPIIGGAVMFLVLTGGTKTGRDAVRNAGTSAYKATGWKSPRTAIVHYSGRAGDKTGAAFAATARKTRNAAVKLAERRWNKRATSDDPPGATPPIRRVQPDRPAPGVAAPGPAGPPPAWGNPPQPQPGPAPLPTPGPAAGSAPGDPHVPDPFFGSVVHDDDLYTLKPRNPAPGPTGRGGTGGPTTGETAATARRTMTSRSGFRIDLEKPTTDAEFLETCVTLADALRSFSKQVEEWAADVSGLGLPTQVTAPLDAVSEGVGEAATAVNRAASTFADLFEEPREIAARGMKFTGEDAA
ncbi:hypothetical protein BKA00_000439 [Actinomadura coerulea]|uniref:Uncharacterized protein n=1 Tax=Actinomadura coerulea TaxID=46159 RepID=A0A7X0KWQ6_9ACTN|nr:hypothetical protein [Actinomadura coerulea]MBB6393525.1 hypothetical protein [Actinomadura coerulea]GGP92269.1 hypothetical protein GCM10010187_04630 [Actinomadura coerulea]